MRHGFSRLMFFKVSQTWWYGRLYVISALKRASSCSLYLHGVSQRLAMSFDLDLYHAKSEPWKTIVTRGLYIPYIFFVGSNKPSSQFLKFRIQSPSLHLDPLAKLRYPFIALPFIPSRSRSRVRAEYCTTILTLAFDGGHDLHQSPLI